MDQSDSDSGSCLGPVEGQQVITKHLISRPLTILHKQVPEREKKKKKKNGLHQTSWR